MQKTTKEQFEQFKGFARKWITNLGLTDWSVYFYHQDINDVYAETAWHISAGCASIFFCKKWDKGRELTEKELDRLALHEVLHILLAPLVAEAEDRYASKTQIESTEHQIIRRMENTLI